MRKELKYFLVFLGIVLIFSIGFALGQGKKSQSVLSEKSSEVSASPTIEAPLEVDPSLVPVKKVIDGDTIVVTENGRDETLRLIGIDTPEIVDPRKPVQCFAREASDHAKTILSGQMVKLESDPTQGNLDKYKRLLRYVFLKDGTNYNLLMIAEGYAHEYTYSLPYKYQAQFKTAEKEAMAKNLGLWSPTTCNGNTTKAASVSLSPGASVTPASADSNTGSTSTYKPTGTYTCDCSKLCGKISTCDEAYYQLQTCGCSARDSDGDGVPCETLCR